MEKVAIVTGAGHGIGRGVAIAYSEQGYRVILADVNEEGCKETKRLMKEEAKEMILTEECQPEAITSRIHRVE